MDKNSVTGFVLIGLILIGFTFFQSRQARKAQEWQAVQDSIALAERIARGDTIDYRESAAAAAAETAALAATDIVIDWHALNFVLLSLSLNAKKIINPPTHPNMYANKPLTFCSIFIPPFSNNYINILQLLTNFVN